MNLGILHSSSRLLLWWHAVLWEASPNPVSKTSEWECGEGVMMGQTRSESTRAQRRAVRLEELGSRPAEAESSSSKTPPSRNSPCKGLEPPGEESFWLSLMRQKAPTQRRAGGVGILDEGREWKSEGLNYS